MVDKKQIAKFTPHLFVPYPIRTMVTLIHQTKKIKTMKTATKKLSLAEIKVESFVTSLNNGDRETIVGGIGDGHTKAATCNITICFTTNTHAKTCNATQGAACIITNQNIKSMNIAGGANGGFLVNNGAAIGGMLGSC